MEFTSASRLSSHLDRPLATPPPDVTPNFENPPFIGQPVIVIAGIWLPLIVIFAVIRLYAKTKVIEKATLGDWIFCFSCPIGIAMISLQIAIVSQGANGHHAWDVLLRDYTKSAIVPVMASWIMTGPVLWIIKLTLGCFIWEGLAMISWMKYAVLVPLAMTGIFFTIAPVIFGISCGPKRGTDDLAYLRGSLTEACSDPASSNSIITIMIGVINTISDLYLLVLPLSTISSLNLLPQQKYRVCFLLLSGSWVVGCSIAELYFRTKYIQFQSDITGIRIQLFTTTIVEIALGLIIPCMPAAVTVYEHIRRPSLNEGVTGVSSGGYKGVSTISSPISDAGNSWTSPQLGANHSRNTSGDSTMTWNKNTTIEELPFNRPSNEYPRHMRNDSRMKNLPATPLPLRSSPPTPVTPRSPSSLDLPMQQLPRSGVIEIGISPNNLSSSPE